MGAWHDCAQILVCCGWEFGLLPEFSSRVSTDLVDLLEGHCLSGTQSGTGEEWRLDGQRNTWGENVNSTR